MVSGFKDLLSFSDCFFDEDIQKCPLYHSTWVSPMSFWKTTKIHKPNQCFISWSSIFPMSFPKVDRWWCAIFLPLPAPRQLLPLVLADQQGLVGRLNYPVLGALGVSIFPSKWGAKELLRVSQPHDIYIDLKNEADCFWRDRLNWQFGRSLGMIKIGPWPNEIFWEYPNSESHEVGDPDGQKEREKFQVGSLPEVSKPHQKRPWGPKKASIFWCLLILYFSSWIRWTN